MTEKLPQQAAFPLAYTLALHVAERMNIRALGIKGPVTTAYGFNDPKTSSDADVIVEEDRLWEYVSALEKRGWRRRPHWHAPALFPAHSLTMYHELWPVDIDVHVTFPGCFAANDVTFEALWAHRQRLTIAGVQCLVTGAIGSALIALLHALRHPNSPKQIANHRRVVEVFETRDSFADDLDQLAQLAIETEALEALADDFAAWKVHGLPELHEGNQRLWRLYTETHEAGSLAGWLVELRKAPLLKRPAILRRALVPSRTDLERDLKTADLTRGKRLKFIVGRLKDSFGQVRESVAALRRHGDVKDLQLYSQEPEQGSR